MSDVLVTLIVLAAILLLADVLLMGGGMTMTAMSGMAGAFAHPLVAGALVVLVVILVMNMGGVR
jgi:hypothetical protein